MNERKELRKARKLEARIQQEIDNATRALLQSGDGRQFLWWLLDISMYGQSPFTGNALTTAFACGEHNISQQVLAQLTSVDPEGFLNLLKERNDDRPNNEPNRADASDDD